MIGWGVDTVKKTLLSIYVIGLMIGYEAEASLSLGEQQKELARRQKLAEHRKAKLAREREKSSMMKSGTSAKENDGTTQPNTSVMSEMDSRERKLERALEKYRKLQQELDAQNSDGRNVDRCESDMEKETGDRNKTNSSNRRGSFPRRKYTFPANEELTDEEAPIEIDVDSLDGHDDDPEDSTHSNQAETPEETPKGVNISKAANNSESTQGKKENTKRKTIKNPDEEAQRKGNSDEELFRTLSHKEETNNISNATGSKDEQEGHASIESLKSILFDDSTFELLENSHLGTSQNNDKHEARLKDRSSKGESEGQSDRINDSEVTKGNSSSPVNVTQGKTGKELNGGQAQQQTVNQVTKDQPTNLHGNSNNEKKGSRLLKEKKDETNKIQRQRFQNLDKNKRKDSKQKKDDLYGNNKQRGSKTRNSAKSNASPDEQINMGTMSRRGKITSYVEKLWNESDAAGFGQSSGGRMKKNDDRLPGIGGSNKNLAREQKPKNQANENKDQEPFGSTNLKGFNKKSSKNKSEKNENVKNDTLQLKTELSGIDFDGTLQPDITRDKQKPFHEKIEGNRPDPDYQDGWRNRTNNTPTNDQRQPKKDVEITIEPEPETQQGQDSKTESPLPQIRQLTDSSIKQKEGNAVEGQPLQEDGITADDNSEPLNADEGTQKEKKKVDVEILSNLEEKNKEELIKKTTGQNESETTIPEATDTPVEKAQPKTENQQQNQIEEENKDEQGEDGIPEPDQQLNEHNEKEQPIETEVDNNKVKGPNPQVESKPVEYENEEEELDIKKNEEELAEVEQNEEDELEIPTNEEEIEQIDTPTNKEDEEYTLEADALDLKAAQKVMNKIDQDYDEYIAEEDHRRQPQGNKAEEDEDKLKKTFDASEISDEEKKKKSDGDDDNLEKPAWAVKLKVNDNLMESGNLPQVENNDDENEPSTKHLTHSGASDISGKKRMGDSKTDDRNVEPQKKVNPLFEGDYSKKSWNLPPVGNHDGENDEFWDNLMNINTSKISGEETKGDSETNDKDLEPQTSVIQLSDDDDLLKSRNLSQVQNHGSADEKFSKYLNNTDTSNISSTENMEYSDNDDDNFDKLARTAKLNVNNDSAASVNMIDLNENNGDNEGDTDHLIDLDTSNISSIKPMGSSVINTVDLEGLAT